jgi:quercetin dioxygenase-like cupin family protein
MNMTTTMETVAAKVVGPRDGRAGFLGSIGVRFMIDGEEAGDRFSLAEHPLSARALAAPLHRHSREDEYSYVVEGQVGALLGDEVVIGAPGDLIFKPRNQWHTFWNARSTGAASRDHLAGRLRTILRRTRRARRSRANRAADPGRPLRPLRARDEPRQRPRADPALRSALPRRSDLARPRFSRSL